MGMANAQPTCKIDTGSAVSDCLSIRTSVGLFNVGGTFFYVPATGENFPTPETEPVEGDMRVTFNDFSLVREVPEGSISATGSGPPFSTEGHFTFWEDAIGGSVSDTATFDSSDAFLIQGQSGEAVMHTDLMRFGCVEDIPGCLVEGSAVEGA
jgi:hypothetical protein